jgi:hypothetical protein
MVTTFISYPIHFAFLFLAKLCNERCEQPLFNHHIRYLYHNAWHVRGERQFFPKSNVKIPTRMAKLHPKEAVFEGEVSKSKSENNSGRDGTRGNHSIQFTDGNVYQHR